MVSRPRLPCALRPFADSNGMLGGTLGFERMQYVDVIWLIRWREPFKTSIVRADLNKRRRIL